MKFRFFIVLAVLIGLFVTTIALVPVSSAASNDFFNSCAQNGVDCSAVKTKTGLSTSVWGLVRTALITLGGIAVIVMIIGGIMYATSSGDASGLTAAKNTVLYAAVGLVVAFSAAAIVTLVNNYFG